MIDKIILDLCGGTGAWSKPYKDAGYDVRVVTLPDDDIMTYEPPDNVYGILAAPPCTEFSLAKSNAKRDFTKGIGTVKRCMEIIWDCRSRLRYKKDGCLTFWCLENPKGFLRQFLGMPPHTICPMDFGEVYTKSTDLWGFFNTPKPYEKRMELFRKKNYIMNITNKSIQSKELDEYAKKQDMRRER